jgi:hypothetical protein
MDPRMEQWMKHRHSRTRVQPSQPQQNPDMSPTHENTRVVRPVSQPNQWHSQKQPGTRRGCCGGGKTTN